MRADPHLLRFDNISLSNIGYLSFWWRRMECLHVTQEKRQQNWSDGFKDNKLPKSPTYLFVFFRMRLGLPAPPHQKVTPIVPHSRRGAAA